MTNVYFSQFWSLGAQDQSAVVESWCLVRARSWESHLSSVTSHGQGAFLGLFCTGTHSVHEGGDLLV